MRLAENVKEMDDKHFRNYKQIDPKVNFFNSRIHRINLKLKFWKCKQFKVFTYQRFEKNFYES